jgi:hypothetical protein
MFRLASAVFVAASSITGIAVAAEQSAADGEHLEIALHTNIVANQPSALAASLDEYAGVYETTDGALFVVVRDGESLSVELPENVALPMRAADGPSFVPDATVIRIAFRTDAEGQVHIVVLRSAEEVVVARRVPLRRGIVTIQDI